jgi:hypothetical protein
MHENFNESDIHGGLPDLWRSIAICTAIGVLFGLLGCSDAPSADIKARAAELSSGFKKHAELIGAKQDEALTILREQSTVMAAIKAKVDAIPVVFESERKEVIQSIDEPQETEREPQHTPSILVSAPAVRLHVTYADFHCPPCERLREAVGRGDFAGFEVIESESFAGQKSYPATRYQNRDGQWKVRYGYDALLPQWIRNDVEATNRFVSHGVNTSGGAPLTGAMFPSYRTSAVASQRVSVRSLPRRVSFVGRSNYSTRQSCPTGACPTR